MLAHGSGALPAGLIGDRYGRRRSFSGGFLPLVWVTTLFLVRGARYGIGLPLRNQLQMEFINARERGTTAGFTHAAFDLGGGVGAGLVGILVVDGLFAPAFTVAAVLILIPAILYYVFFDRLERSRSGDLRDAAEMPAAA